MFSEPIALNKIEASDIIDTLYRIFRRDFIESAAMLNGAIWVDPQVARKEDGRECSFWHLTSRGGPGNRFPDFQRAARLEWIKPIVSQPNAPNIRLFYHRETSGKRDLRLYLWAVDAEFVVILQKLGRTTTFLVTSFCVDQPSKQRDYSARFDRYQTKSDPDLHCCEWF